MSSTNKSFQANEKEEELVSSLLPSMKTISAMRNYKNFYIPEYDVMRIERMDETFCPRPTDVILASMPKSGMTWLKALAFATLHRKNYIPWTSTPHPLLNLHPHECVPFLDVNLEGSDQDFIESMQAPRLLSVHTPFSLLPPSIVGTCKIIYVCREPKDVFTSYWKFHSTIMTSNGIDNYSLDNFFELYCIGEQPFGPIWEHMLEYWRQSQERPDKVLFLKYEMMMENPSKVLRRMSEFMGCKFSDEEVDKMGMVEKIVSLCSFDSLNSVEHKHENLNYGSISIKKSNFYRKGKVGDWVNHLTPEMGIRLDKITKGKLNGSGLDF